MESNDEVTVRWSLRNESVISLIEGGSQLSVKVTASTVLSPRLSWKTMSSLSRGWHTFICRSVTAPTLDSSGELPVSSYTQSTEKWLEFMLTIISNLISISISWGTFPVRLKLAKLTPFLEKVGLDNVSSWNYHLMSNLSNISKQVECLILARIQLLITSSRNIIIFQSA